MQHTTLIATIGLLLWGTSLAVTIPPPTLLFKANAVPQPQPLTATCPVTVVSNQSAFVCYTEGLSGNQTVQYVNPTDASKNGVPAAFDAKSSFVHPPIPLSQVTAIAYSSAPPNNSFYVMFSFVSPQVRFVDRRGSNADVVYASDLNLVFVPIGVTPRLGWYDTIVAYNVMATTDQETIKWSRDFKVPVNYPYTTRMSTPVYYRGVLYVATKDYVYALNATTGAIIKNVTDPCNFGLQEDQWLMLKVITVGSDANGPLDVFLFVANTSLNLANPQLSVCRFSHNSFAKEWRLDYYDNVIVDDVTGALNTILLSAHLVGVSNPNSAYMTIAMMASNSVHLGKIDRFDIDKNSFPAVLPQPISACQTDNLSSFVLQINGSLTAFCASDVSTAVWTSPFGCTHRATVDATSNSIICTTWATSIQRIDADGNVVWYTNTVPAAFTASIVNGVVWVVDNHATVYGLSLAPSVLPPPPLPATLYTNKVTLNPSLVTATCPPTIQSKTSAFVCYNLDGTDTVQYINPISEASNGVPSPFPSQDQFVFRPIPISDVAAITFTANVSSSSYVIFNSTNAQVTYKDRSGSLALPTYAPDLHMSFVPFGVVPRAGWYDSLVAFNVNAATEQESLVWSKDYIVAANYTSTTSISSPIYYQEYLYVASRTTFYKYNASTGALIASITNPCNFSGSGEIFAEVVNIGKDANGPLDAFMLFANTSTVTDGLQFSACRVSHNSGSKEWQVNIKGDILVQDIVGGTNTIFISGEAKSESASPYRFVVLGYSATDGSPAGTLYRTSQDQYSFPAVLPQAVSGCQETVVVQVNGQLTAYCTETFGQVKWTSSYGCTHRPHMDAPSNSIICTTWATSVQRLDSDGNAVWQTTAIKGVFTPYIVDDVVWVVDLNSVLYGLSIPPAGVTTPAPTVTPAPPVTTTTAAPTSAPGTPAPTSAPGTPIPTHAPGTQAPTAAPGTPAPTAAPGTPAPTAAPGTPVPSTEAPTTEAPGGQAAAPPEGLSGGAAAGIAITVILVVGGLAGGTFFYHRRNLRRRAFREQRMNDAINDSGYGGLA